MANIIVTLSGPISRSVVAASLKSDKRTHKLSSFLAGLSESVGSNPTAQVQILNDNAVSAHGIITIVDYTSMTDGDTYQIGAKVLTAKSSGAAANQFNIGASNTASASNLSLALNTYYGDFVHASSVLGVVTITANVAGTAGNAIPIIITQTSAGATNDASLTGGLADTSTPISYKSF